MIINNSKYIVTNEKSEKNILIHFICFFFLSLKCNDVFTVASLGITKLFIRRFMHVELFKHSATQHSLPPLQAQMLEFQT